MLSKDMYLPAVFDCPVSDRTKVVITHKINNNRFAGYTASVNAGSPIDARNGDRWAGLWTQSGKCVYTDANDNTENARTERTIKFGPKPEQVQYEKLTVDQRAILKLLVAQGRYSSNYPTQYVADTLNVAMSDTDTIIDYAIKKDFK